MKKLLLIAPLLALAGCGAGHLEFPKPPLDKTRCADEPAVPAEPVTDAANGQYLKGMRGAWVDCRDTVAWWRDWSAALAKAGKKQKLK